MNAFGWFPQSIRWRLQLWYGLALVLVVGAFGVASDRLDRARQLRQIDSELQQRVSVLAATMIRPGFPREAGGGPPSGFGGPGGPGGPGPERPGMGLGAEGDRQGDRRRGPARGPAGDLPPFDPLRRPPRMEIRLTEEDSRLFESESGKVEPFYYVIWIRDGRLLSHSASAPMPVSRPERVGAGSMPSVRMRGSLRESFLFSSSSDCILVGRSIAPDLAEMGRRTLWLVLLGAGVLLVGLVGGGWFVARAIKPVESIGATAARISAGDLSQRIPIAEKESELGQLAGVLNATFARLETAFAQQAQFTSDAAHELRTPVTVILTQIQTALSRERAAADYRETLEACQRAAQRMRRLIESLLALARFDAGQEPLRRARCDVAAIVRDAVELVRPLALERGVELQAELEELVCDGDAERLGQVIVNLLTNSIQYNHPGGIVHVTGLRNAQTIEVAVKDTGAGIVPEDVPRVFDRFYRADRARTGSVNAGLGLAICKAVIEAHGGTIECQSTVGSGTTVTFRLPA